MLTLSVVGRASAQIGSRVVGPGAELVFAGLLVLGLDGGREHTREGLAELLWPDRTPSDRSARLRWLLNRFRNLGLSFDADLSRVSLSRRAIDADYLAVDGLPLETIGPILPGYAPAFSPAFTRWLDDKREVITTEVLRQLLPRLTAARRSADWNTAMGVAIAIERLDPLNEEAVLTIAEARCRLGAKAQALDGLDAYLAALGDDRPELHLPAKVLQRRIRAADDAAAPANEPTFVGRGEQLRQIATLVDAARGGAGGALMVTGPGGIGKTRLLDEAIAHAAVAGMQIVRVQCQPGDVTHPLSALIDLIPKLLALRGAAGANPANFERLSKLGQLARGDEASGVPASPEVARGQTAAAVFDVLDAASGEVPVLIAIDDVQWADAALAWLWEYAATWCSAHRVAFLFGFRTAAPKQPTLKVPSIALSSLETASGAKLLDDLLARADRPANDDVRRALLVRGAGSPLFLREVARQWAATGSIDSLPTTLAALLDSGISALSAPALHALQVAAVLGTHATLDRMERVTQIQRGAFIETIVELEAAGIVTADAKGTVFGHVLWADAALSRISAAVLRMLHRHAAESLDAELAADPSPTLLWEAARHWEGAGRPEAARAAIVRGAVHLARQGFPGEAADVYTRTLQHTQDAGEQLVLLRQRIELLLLAGRTSELVNEIDRHEQLARQVDPTYDRHNRFELLRLGTRHLQVGDMEAVLESALACARDAAATAGHRLQAAKEAARMAHLISPSALDELRDIVAGIQPRTSEEELDRARTELEYHLLRGNVREAVRIAEHIVDERRRGDDARLTASAMGLCATVYKLVGRFADMRALLLDALAFSKRFGLLQPQHYLYETLIGTTMHTVPAHVSRAWIEEAREPTRAFAVYGAASSAGHMGNLDAELCIAEGRYAEALRVAHPLAESLAFRAPMWRAPSLAIHLAARLGLGRDDDIAGIAAGLASSFDEPVYDVDWAAEVYADYLQRCVSLDAAVRFARRYVQEIRRELYEAPAELRSLASREQSE